MPRLGPIQLSRLPNLDRLTASCTGGYWGITPVAAYYADIR